MFEGTKIDDFKVEIIGVLENVGPEQSMILARLEGGPLEKTGVIAGMSGSPVYIDGKLVGAVAYGFPFSKETIGGITPIAEMIEATQRERAARGLRALPRRRSARPGRSAPLDREAMVAALAPAAARARPGAPPGGEARHCPARSPASRSPRSRCPSSSPGFDPATFEWARGVFSGMGFTPGDGRPAARARCPGPLPDLQPGGAVGISLIEGDMDLSATGTVTHIDDDRVYAFGHPFYNLGPDAVPDEEGVRLLGLPEPLPVLEDQLRRATPWAPSSRTASPPSRAGSAARRA